MELSDLLSFIRRNTILEDLWMPTVMALDKVEFLYAKLKKDYLLLPGR